MASNPTLTRLQAEFDNSPEFLQTVTTLLESGATPEFICHYRRDETGDIGEARIFEIAERLHFLEDLETRKQAIRDQATEKNLLDDALQATLVDCFDQDLLDDIYQTFRPSRRTPGVQAREKGLGDVTDKILAGALGEQSLPDVADALISTENDLPTRESVLEGILHILAEGLAADPVLRSRFRRELASGTLKSVATAASGKGAIRFKDYFEYEQPVRRVQGNHLLNLWRGEREGVLKVTLSLPPEKSAELVKKHAKINAGEDVVLGQFLDLVYQHAASNLLLPSCESDVRHQIKERVDRTTAQNLARNLRSQLMAPPLGNKKTLGIRASRNTVWLAVLGEDGSVVKHLTLNLDNAEKRAASIATMAELLETENPEGIALPHGRHQDVTSEIVREACAKLTTKIAVVPVDEAASAVHATSSSARKEWPGLEVGVRTAISLANRLQDSMHELLSLDPKALGLGHALDEVHQGLLTRILDQTIASCVAKIGMDINRASIAHLVRVPGMTRDMAKRIFDRRKKNGSFRTLAALRESDLLSAVEFEHVAGFLRICGGDQPLDSTGIHPNDYEVVDRLAAAEGCAVAELAKRRIKTSPGDVTDEGRGTLRVRDIVAELAHFGDDVRGKLVLVQNENVSSIEDLRQDMELQGRVTNLTEFGAFVDLGIHQDGLVHVSQIPAGRLRDPRRMLAVGEVIQVFVLRVEPDKKRISLSMHKPRHIAEGRQPTIGERMQSGGRNQRRGRDRDSRPAEPLTRAARAPDGRRAGGRRGAPRPAGADSDRRPGGFGGGGGRDRDRGRGGRGGGTPRVVTIESERPIPEVRGHRGELTSLSSLANLLGGGASAEPTPTPETPVEKTQPEQTAAEQPTETPSPVHETEAVTETPTEAVTETPTEAVTETPTEAATESESETSTETPTENPVDTPAEPEAEPLPEPSPETEATDSSSSAAAEPDKATDGSGTS
jgi:uncharacterized protein